MVHPRTAPVATSTTIMTTEPLHEQPYTVGSSNPNPEPATRETFPGELMIWLSPAFPVGGFAYSQGLETAVERGLVHHGETLEHWLRALIEHGSLRNELILLALMRNAETDQRLRELAKLSAALQPSAERWAEATVQGRAFRDAFEAGWAGGGASPFAVVSDCPVTLVSAVAIAARDRNFEAATTLEAFAIAFLSNLVSAAIRLSVVGQFAGQACLSALMKDVRAATAHALMATEDDLGSATFMADLASIQHETQTVRLFRS